MKKYIFVTGGVTSSLGKGIISSSLGLLLKAVGYKVTIQKFDPYLNIDPGTMSPYEHGECYVTKDGAETDLDLGHYERFLGVSTSQDNNVTTGRIYNNVISKEIKSSLKYEEIKIQKSDASTYIISVSDNKKTPNLSTILKQISKHKLNVIEANFEKVNLEKIFRTITTVNN